MKYKDCSSTCNGFLPLVSELFNHSCHFENFVLNEGISKFYYK